MDHGEDYSIADISMLGWVRNLIGFYGARDLVDFDALNQVPAGSTARPRPPRGAAWAHDSTTVLTARGHCEAPSNRHAKRARRADGGAWLRAVGVMGIANALGKHAGARRWMGH